MPLEKFTKFSQLLHQIFTRIGDNMVRERKGQGSRGTESDPSRITRQMEGGEKYDNQNLPRKRKRCPKRMSEMFDKRNIVSDKFAIIIRRGNF